MISASEIKRQIFSDADTRIITKPIGVPGIPDGEVIELGTELERITKMPGWAAIDKYMMENMNLVGLAVNDGSETAKGVAKGFIGLMQFIHLAIKNKNIILEQERIKHETKTVPEDEIN